MRCTQRFSDPSSVAGFGSVAVDSQRLVMYSRAGRVTDLCSKSSSPAGVGPGSYTIQRSALNRSDSFAPFLSLSSRPSVFHLINSEQCSPGPAHYNGVLTWAPVPGGGSLQNRSRRFKESESNIPGPGTYDIIQPWGKKHHLPSTQDRGNKVEKKWEQSCTNPSAVFKSTLQRMSAPGAVQDTPSPGTYNVQDAYEKVFGRRGRTEPRSKAAQKRQSSFISTAPRNSTVHSDPHVPGCDLLPFSDLVLIGIVRGVTLHGALNGLKYMFIQRFERDIEDMLGHRPNWYWKIMWIFVSPFLLISLFTFYIINYIQGGTPTYQAWDKTTGKSLKMEYPVYGQIFIGLLIVSSVSCVPIAAIYTFCLGHKRSAKVCEEVNTVSFTMTPKQAVRNPSSPATL
ncbi:Sodium- and chloride-dependent transporter XTRP3B [Bagarius yarrelli]|uniref:Sodium-and chloride-dependent transporter XTRP3B n=1 Tax=Bagarius yarrelli TaxID=175774 RepID=A0A556VCS9_BAGYA|nr:Sodium- and chloride-dependent transporter XTRP3B [Bagarius yarrelli]